MQYNKIQPSQHIISKISNYMLSPKNMLNVTKHFLSKTPNIELIKTVKPKQKEFYKTKQLKNALFLENNYFGCFTLFLTGLMIII